MITGFILGIIASLIATYLYSIRDRKQLSYLIKGRTVLNSKQEVLQNINLGFKVDETEIAALSIEIFSIWNSGLSTVENNDIKDKLIIKCNNNTESLLGYSIEKTTAKSSKFNAKIINDEDIEVTFNHLDTSEGGIIKIYYGKEHSENSTFEGGLKGTGRVSILPNSKTYFQVSTYFLRNQKIIKKIYNSINLKILMPSLLGVIVIFVLMYSDFFNLIGEHKYSNIIYTALAGTFILCILGLKDLMKLLSFIFLSFEVYCFRNERVFPAEIRDYYEKVYYEWKDD